jgi:predicted HTH transcriptional regulator
MSYVLTYIAEGEHLKQDFKMRIDDAQKIARSLVAFANTSGGRLLIGVKDNGNVSGIRPEEEIHMIIRSAEEFCQPSIHFTHSVWKVEGKAVLEIQIEESSVKPHLAKVEEGWKAFVREHDVTLPASNVWIAMQEVSSQEDSNELFQMSEREEQLFALLKQQPFTLNQLARKAGTPRPILIRKLAKLMKWGIVTEQFDQGKATYSLK